MDDRQSAVAPGYAQRLQALEGKRWKRWLDVQAPYRWNVRRLCRGDVLDVGCGLGRNLDHLRDRPDGAVAVGVDPNRACVETARERGLVAFTPEALDASDYGQAGRFDTILVAHVLEHLDEPTGDALLREHLPRLRPGGIVVVFTPQESGQRSDPTHVRYVDQPALAATARRLGLEPVLARSFPLPRVAGRAFRYNEHNAVWRKPA
jgi:2-polyprenyl-3-methyl-5-hydroxy-6-metoxy-1,4-benzoquinol methylase